MNLADLYVRVLPDTSDFGPTLNRKVRAAGDRGGKSFKQGFSGGMGRSLIPVAALAGAAVAAKRVLSGAWSEGQTALKAAGQTNAVIKSTGGVARVTATDVDKLSDSLSRQRGVDDELITAGQNMLLTFTNVQNRVGKGNDIFTQATKIVGDMSVATGTDLVKSNLQLGKALNDPIRGMGALRRVGVTFTKEQEKQITTLQKSGDMAGAQGIILAELTKEFAGSAAAQATLSDKMSVGWKNVQERVGKGLNASLKALWPTLEGLGRIGGGVFRSLDQGIGGTKGTVQTFTEFLSTHQGDITLFFVEGGKAALGMAEAVLMFASGGLRAIGLFDQGVGRFLSGFLDMVGKVIDGAAKAFGWIPGLGPKLDKASADFAEFSATAKEGFEDQGSGAIAAADKLEGYSKGVGKAKDKLTELGETEVWNARQRDAAAAASIAINDIGKKGDVTRLKLKGYNIESGRGSKAQQEFAQRVHASRDRMLEQRAAGVKAGDSQAKLTQRWNQGKEALRREFIQMGFSKEQARKLAEQYGKVPTKAETKVSAPGMDTTRRNVRGLDDDINALNSKTVNARVTFTAGGQRVVMKPGTLGGGLTAFAGGGVMPGWSPGHDIHRFTSPTGGVLDLSGGEAFMVPEWTRAVGGPKEVDRMNRAARQSFAGGGTFRHIAVNTSSNGKPPVAAITNLIMAQVMAKIVKNAQDNLDLPMQGITGPVGPLTTFRGGRFTTLGAANLRRAEQIAGVTMRVMQGGWMPRTPWSGTSHAGDAVDTQASHQLGRAIRAVGWAWGDRTGLGNWGAHGHGVPSPSTGRAGGSAIGQFQNYMARGGARQSMTSPWGLWTGGTVARDGWAKVGERGPETIYANAGDKVVPDHNRAIVIMVDLGEGLTRRIEGVLDENDEFKASVGRSR